MSDLPKPEKYVRVKAIVMWARTKTPDERSNGKYNLELCNLSEAAVEAVRQDLGLEAKFKAEKADKGFYLKVSSSNPIKAFDKASGEEITDELGNGTEVEARLFRGEVRSGPYKGKASAKLARLNVTHLIPFVPGGDEDGDEAL